MSVNKITKSFFVENQKIAKDLTFYVELSKFLKVIKLNEKIKNFINFYVESDYFLTRKIIGRIKFVDNLSKSMYTYRVTAGSKK